MQSRAWSLESYNDIAARFLVVLESEVDCYWVFKLYVENRKADFSETGMIHRTGECCVYAHTQDACTYARTQTTAYNYIHNIFAYH